MHYLAGGLSCGCRAFFLCHFLRLEGGEMYGIRLKRPPVLFWAMGKFSQIATV